MNNPPTPLTTAPRKPAIRIEISASLKATNGIQVEVNANRVIMAQPGPQGGRGNTIEIALADWDAINETVKEVRAAIERASQAVRGAE